MIVGERQLETALDLRTALLGVDDVPAEAGIGVSVEYRRANELSDSCFLRFVQLGSTLLGGPDAGLADPDGP